jgi:hypothetical protein
MVLAVSGVTVAVSAVVTTVVSALVAAMVKWGGRIGAAVRSKVVADHQPLYQAGWSLSRAESTDNRLRVNVSCAPERSRRSVELDPDDAIGFVRAELAGWVTADPAVSSPTMGVRFEAPGGTQEGYVWVWPSGRVDLSWHLPFPAEVDGRVIVPLLDVLRPVVALAQAVRARSYRAVFPDGWWARIRRFDWCVTVATSIVDGAGVTRSWDDVAFPGRRPARAGSQLQAFCPDGGYGAAGLRGSKPSRPLGELVSIVLESLLKSNGYHDVGDAIADTVAAIEAANQTRSPTPPPPSVKGSGTAGSDPSR